MPVLFAQTVTDVDGNMYNTVSIGSQTWLRENLKVRHNPDGTDIINLWSYQNDTSLVSTYGLLYDWNAAMNGSTGEGAQGICPDGWHIPTDSEWAALGEYLGGNAIAGGKMKEADTLHWIFPNTGATNESEFTALPAGEKDGEVFQYLRQYSVIWSSTQTSATKALYRYIAYNDAELHPYNYFKYFGYSVRCIRDISTGIHEHEQKIHREVSFIPHEVDSLIDGPGGIYTADLDGDGLQDIISAAIDANSIYWWKNLGGKPLGWSKNNVDNNFAGAIYVSAADIDSDQDMDILGAAYNGHQLAWWENSDNGQIWIKHLVKTGFVQAHEVMACDMDLDGDLDILGVSAGLNTISWFENDGNVPPVTWAEQVIANDFGGARSVDAGDIDEDGDVDIAGAALTDNEVAWWLNEGGVPYVWTKFSIKTGFNYAHKVQLVDIDLDQDSDILATAYSGGIRWFENQGGTPVGWLERFVSGFYSGVIAWSFDINLDGMMDIAASAQGTGNIAMWLNQGGNPFAWNVSILDNFEGAWPLFYSDLDDDGDTDLVCGGNEANRIRWYENDLITGLNPTPLVDHDMTGIKCFPNPCSGKVKIEYPVYPSSYITIRIIDHTGRGICILERGEKPAGLHCSTWDSRNVRPGIYFVELSYNGTGSKSRGKVLIIE